MITAIIPVKGLKGREMQQLIILQALLNKKPTKELQILLYLIRNSDRGKFPVLRGYRDLMAKEVDSTSVGVRNALNQLVRKGLIHFINKGKRNNLGSYKINEILQFIAWQDEVFIFKFFFSKGENQLHISHSCT